MHRRRLHHACLTVLAAALGVLALPPVASAQPLPAIAGSRVIRLVTGDVVTLSAASTGPRIASLQRAHPHGAAGRFHTLDLGSRLYVIPQSAVPYLGTTLDLSLFDVTGLARTGTAVRTTYRDGHTSLATPSLAAARGFGAALGRQWAADHAAGTHRTGLFSTIASMRAASAAAAPDASSDRDLHTLTVTGRDVAGHPDDGDLLTVWNVDDLRSSPAPAVFHDGIVTLSVPGGHYSAMLSAYTRNLEREDVLPQFDVAGDTTVGLDARRATSRFDVRTPRPATAQVGGYILSRTDSRGAAYTETSAGFAPDEFAFSPTSTRVTVGRLHLMLNARLFSPPTSTQVYSYDLAYPVEQRIPRSLLFTVHERDLAGEWATYPAQQAQRYETALDTRIAVPPWLTRGFLIATDLPMTVPTRRLEFYSAYPGLRWRADHFEVFGPDGLFGEVQGSFRSYRAGARTSVSWAGPAHPRLYEGIDPYRGVVECPACLGDGRLNVLAAPYSDNSPLHFGRADEPSSGLAESQHFTITGDGATLATGHLLDTQVPLPTSVSTVRIDYHTTRSSADFLQSTDVETSWQVQRAGPTTALPAGWRCGRRADAPARCRELALITASYALPSDAAGALAPGSVRAGLTLGHLGTATARFVRVSAQVSFDAGATWTNAVVSRRAAGRFGLRFDVPAGAAYGALRVSTRDANGATFDETIQRAFAVSDSAAAGAR